MIPSIIQHLDQWIPPESQNVRTLFEKATTSNEVTYGSLARYGYASLAIICSSVNVIEYTLVLGSRLVTHIIYLKLDEISERCFQDARHALNSLYFAAGMAALIFATVIASLFNPGGYSLKTRPIAPPTRPSNEDSPSILRSQYSLVLKTLNLPLQQILNTDFKFYADLNDLKVGPIQNIRHLYQVLQNREDLVLIVTAEKDHYLVRRSSITVQNLIKQGHTAVYLPGAPSTPVSLRKKPRAPSPVLHEQSENVPAPSSSIAAVEISISPLDAPKQPDAVHDDDLNLVDTLIGGVINLDEWSSSLPQRQQGALIHPPASAPLNTVVTLIDRLSGGHTSQIPIPEDQRHESQRPSLADSLLGLSQIDLPLGQSWIQLPAETGEIQPSVPTPVQPVSRLLSAAVRVKVLWKNHITGYEDISKEMKYRHVFAHLMNILQTPHCNELRVQIENEHARGPSALTAKCIYLSEIIEKPSIFKDARKQYQAYVEALREAKDLMKNTATTDICVTFVHLLAYERFAGLKLYGYCQSLVELISGPFEQPLALENFWDELQKRNKKVQDMPVEQGITQGNRFLKKLRGHLNIDFDPLLDSNVPYIYGEIRKGNHVITILRHGVPVYQSEPLGPMKRVLWGSAGNAIPEANSDYIAFIEAALSQEKNILHFIFENAEWKYHGDESSRVQMRLNLAKHSNFFPVALRMDGDFIHPKPYTCQNLKTFKEKFVQELLGDVNKTGFCIPDKVRTADCWDGQSIDAVLKQCMDDVQAIYFQNRDSLETLGEYQAFILLTYAQMANVFCEKLTISILEALCKDDIDRGNAFKAVLILDHLYRTGNLNPQMLQQLMVSIIAPPLIVKKQPILPARAIFIQHVIHVIQRAQQVASLPAEPYAYVGNFSVVTEPYQGLAPIGGTCRSKEEYEHFLHQVMIGEITFNAPIVENLVAKCAASYRKTDLINRGGILHQLERDLKDLNMSLNGKQLNPERMDKELKKESDRERAEKVADTLLRTLHGAQIPENEIWDIIATFQQALGEDLFKMAKEMFENPMLNYIVLQDSKTMSTDWNSGLFLTVREQQASIACVSLFKVVNRDDPEQVIAQIRTKIEIADHRTGHAMATMTINPPVYV